MKMTNNLEQKQFTIRKKIAKHGPNSIIVIPKLLREELRPKTIIEVNFKSITNKDQYPYTITKKIAKHGVHSIIVIPKFLQGELCPQTIVEISIKVLSSVNGGEVGK